MPQRDYGKRPSAFVEPVATRGNSTLSPAALRQHARERLDAMPNAPRHIAVEGPIGVGKTTLCRRLAETLNYDVLLEQAEANPFLPRFYSNPGQHALATQLFFLLQRAEQLQRSRQNELFSSVQVSDFLLEKDRLFAELTLNRDELALYQGIYEHLSLNQPAPDLVIYLQAPVKVLQERITRRGIAYEQRIDAAYLEALNDAYSRLFHYYDAAPLLIVNVAEIDLVNSEADYKLLLDHVLSAQQGRRYLNPQPMLQTHPA